VVNTREIVSSMVLLVDVVINSYLQDVPVGDVNDSLV
jgi:hypothetical protein